MSAGNEHSREESCNETSCNESQDFLMAGTLVRVQALFLNALVWSAFPGT